MMSKTKNNYWGTKKRPNETAKIPYGYRASKDNLLVLVANDEIVVHVEQAMDYLDNGQSYREVANWLSEATGETISHQGIANIWKRARGDTSSRTKQLNAQKRKSAPKTKEQRELASLKKKEAAAKRSLTVTKKKLGQLKEQDQNQNKPSTPKHTYTEGVSGNLDFDAPPANKEIIFAPNPGPQTEFLSASEREVLYGGAAGGGKSYGLLADPMRYFSNGNFVGLILRRTNDELRELIWKSQELYPKAYPGARWQEKKSQWVFPSGSKLWMTYLEREEDVLRYQGQAFSYIAFDELTQHATPFAWNYMRSRLRTTDPELPIFLRATSNPGGPGHSWVKRMFIDPSPANAAFPATDIDTGSMLQYPEGHAKQGKPLFYRKFIPATLRDNPYLYKDGDYEANLLSLPEMQRRQLLEGDWAVADGAAFPEFRQSHHVVEPFEIPHDWRRFRSCDYGYSSYSAVHWFAIDPSYETLIVYRELYVSKHTGRDLAKAILPLERGEDIQYGILDSSCWHQRGQIGPSIAEEMISEGCRWRPSDRSAGARVAGRNRFHEVLKYDEETKMPGIVFFDTCRQIIADLPVIPSDPKGGDDIDVRYRSDHTYDSIRYGIMSRPRAKSPFDDWASNKTEPSWKPASVSFGY
tara:strand:+ start:391 stop:2304 length:1914 start_codon:yes stop_codon:yes gene_type:complete